MVLKEENLLPELLLGLRLRSPWNPEEESPAGNPNHGLPSQTRGGVTNSAACLAMSAYTPGFRLSTACQEMSTCTACTPPGLRPPRTLRRSHQQAVLVPPCDTTLGQVDLFIGG